MASCKSCREIFPPQELVEGFCAECNTPRKRKEYEERIEEEKNQRLQNAQKKNRVLLINDEEKVVGAPTGFSWSTLFLGPVVPLLRGDLEHAFFFLIVPLALVTVVPFLIYEAVRTTAPQLGSLLAFVPLVLLTLIFLYQIRNALTYNKSYIKKLLDNGYRPADEEAARIVAELERE